MPEKHNTQLTLPDPILEASVADNPWTRIADDQEKLVVYKIALASHVPVVAAVLKHLSFGEDNNYHVNPAWKKSMDQLNQDLLKQIGIDMSDSMFM